MSKQFIKSYGDFLGTKKWKWVDNLTLTMSNGQRCFFTHGLSADILKVSVRSFKARDAAERPALSMLTA